MTSAVPNMHLRDSRIGLELSSNKNIPKFDATITINLGGRRYGKMEPAPSDWSFYRSSPPVTDDLHAWNSFLNLDIYTMCPKIPI
ncbi:MAG: hypothetical protein DYG89_29085 [Caldilinea sp. CFX5]|nr:hypothetical protein [Caldilinea sp. CFX5]